MSEHDSSPSSPNSSTEDIPGTVQDSEQRSESPISFSMTKVSFMIDDSEKYLGICTGQHTATKTNYVILTSTTKDLGR